MAHTISFSVEEVSHFIEKFKKNPPDYQQWDEARFRASTEVEILTPLQKSFYKNLLQYAFKSSEFRPCLPDDDNVLWVMAMASSKLQWTENMTAIRANFARIKVIVDGKERRILARNGLLKEASRLINYRSSQASNRIGKRRLTTVNDRKRSLTIVNDCGTIAGDSIDSIDSTDRKIDRKIERKEEETTNLPSTTLPSALSLEEEMALEILYKRMVAEWKEIHGESATCPYPTFPEEKLSWKVLIGNHDHDLILKAFTLWAQEQYEQGNTERYPLGKFIRVADKYMQKIVPLKTATVVAQIEAEAKKVAMDEAKRLNDAIRAARKKEEEEESKDAGPEAYGL